MDSMKMAFVFSSTAAANACGSVEETNLVPMPNFFKVTIEGRSVKILCYYNRRKLPLKRLKVYFKYSASN